MKLSGCLYLLLASLICSLTCTEAVAFSEPEFQGSIEKRFAQTQQSVAIRRAQRKLARRHRKKAPKISTVSFASYMSSNMEENPTAQPEQSAFKPKCHNKSAGEEAEAPRTPAVAVSEVGSSGDAIVRGPASESSEATSEPAQGY